MKALKFSTIISQLFTIILISNITEQYLNNRLTAALSGNTKELILIVVSIMALSLISSLALLGVFLSHCARELNRPLPTLTQWNDLAKESLRSIGVASMWLFAFLIPGLLRFIDFLFVPFVVFLDADYQADKQDALSLARILGKKVRFKTAIVWVFFTLALPFLMTTFFSEQESFKDYPLQATGLSFIEAILQFLFLSILFKFWQHFQKRRAHGAHV